MLDDELLDDDDPEDVDLEDLDQNFGPHIQQQQQREAGGLSSRALQRALMSLADEKIMPSRSAIAAGEVLLLLEQLRFARLLRSGSVS